MNDHIRCHGVRLLCLSSPALQDPYEVSQFVQYHFHSPSSLRAQRNVGELHRLRSFVLVERKESLIRKGSSRLVAAIAECLHTANIRRFSQLRRERGPCPRTRPVCQRQQANPLPCHLDTSPQKAIDHQPSLHPQEDQPWS